MRFDQPHTDAMDGFHWRWTPARRERGEANLPCKSRSGRGGVANFPAIPFCSHRFLERDFQKKSPLFFDGRPISFTPFRSSRGAWRSAFGNRIAQKHRVHGLFVTNVWPPPLSSTQLTDAAG
mmetsp:Transcript_20784/g.44379  ORF Transcript_20784/g.44379 Transcript_20784/m.44379 type:complete len:122 (+) Transcript_20784:2515-2880(+)